MIADVEKVSPPEASAQTIEITVTYDPTATDVTKQFTFDTPTGNPFLFTEESTSLVVTLVGAEWNSSPVSFVVSPTAAPQPSIDGDTITFTLDPPLHYFEPWAFNFNINFGDVLNIASPLFFLIKYHENDPTPPIDLFLTLTYSSSDGTFNLLSGTTPGSPDGPVGILLESQLVLLNVVAGNVTIDLTGATYSTNPIVWSAGSKPTWIQGLELLDDVTLRVEIRPGHGRAAGLQFAVVTDDVTILSPDPILINATIGDG